MNDDEYENDLNFWSEDALITKFPRIETYLKNQVTRNKNLYGSLVRDVQYREQKNNDNKLKNFDREINLNQVLSKNVKYRNIGRNRPPPRTILEPILVANIKHNSSRKISKITIENLSKSKMICPKYTRHMRTYDDNEFRRVYALGMEPPKDEEVIEEIPEKSIEIEADKNLDDELVLTENEEINTNGIKEAIENNQLDKTSLLPAETLKVINEEPEIKRKLIEEEGPTPRVLTPASDILEEALPSYAGDDPYGTYNPSDQETSISLAKLVREPTISYIVPKNQAAQANHLLKNLNKN
jgi:hypothetical protein